MRRVQQLLRVLILWPLVGTSPATGQTIVGIVRGDLTGQPLSAVSVMLLDSTDTAIRWTEGDAAGGFVIDDLDNGVYRVFADRLGYRDILSEYFRLQGTGSVEMELHLVPEPMELEPLVVTAERRRLRLEVRGYYRRERSGMGYCFDAERIAAEKPIQVSDLLRTVPAVQVRHSRFGGAVATTLRMGRSCRMKVVVDGFTVDVSDTDLDHWVNPSSVIGMEVYPSAAGVPVEHRGPDAACGVLLIWTR